MKTNNIQAKGWTDIAAWKSNIYQCLQFSNVTVLSVGKYKVVAIERGRVVMAIDVVAMWNGEADDKGIGGALYVLENSKGTIKRLQDMRIPIECVLEFVACR